MIHLSGGLGRGLMVLFAVSMAGGASSAARRADGKQHPGYSVAINGPTLVRSGVQCHWTSTTDIPSPLYEWSVITEDGSTIVGNNQDLDYTFVAPPAHPILQLRVTNQSGADESDSRVMGVSQTGPLC